MADVFTPTPYDQLSAAQQSQIEDVKSDASMMMQGLNTMADSRELSLAKTKLEEAVMWAVKHITTRR